MLKGKDKNTFIDVILMFLLLALNIHVDFEQVNIGWFNFANIASAFCKTIVLSCFS